MHRISLPALSADVRADHADIWQPEEGYWHHGAAYVATCAETAQLEAAVASLSDCFAEAMDRVVASETLLRSFYLDFSSRRNVALQNLAARSWSDKRERSYPLNRFDFAWDNGTLKLLERNGDGWLGLIHCTGVAQEHYADILRKTHGHKNLACIGNLGTSFKTAFRDACAARDLGADAPVVFMAHGGNPHINADSEILAAEESLTSWLREEDRPLIVETTYDKNHTGWTTELELLWHDGAAAFFPFYGYAYCCYMQATLPERFPYRPMLIPAWEMLASHKRMLALLYDMFPDNPYLLPTVHSRHGLPGQKSIVKCGTGCQGAESIILTAQGRVEHDHRGRLPYRDDFAAAENYIVQAFADEVNNPDGSTKVLHVFTANGKAAAAGFREARGPIVGGATTSSHYVPLFIDDRLATAAAPCYLADEPQAPPPSLAKRARAWAEYAVGLRVAKPEF